MYKQNVGYIVCPHCEEKVDIYLVEICSRYHKWVNPEKLKNSKWGEDFVEFTCDELFVDNILECYYKCASCDEIICSSREQLGEYFVEEDDGQ